MGQAALKMYDKFGQVLRLETTANGVTFFKHHRPVEHRDGTRELKNAPVRKTIYSLPALADLMGAANRRYLEFLSTLDDASPGLKQLDRVSATVREGERTYRGFNFLASPDVELLRTVARGEFTKVAFRTKIFAAIFRTPMLARCRTSSNACAATGSSRKSAARTSTTSLASDVSSLRRC